MTQTPSPPDGLSRPSSTAGSCPTSDANRLGLDLKQEAGFLGYRRPIVDIHTHLRGPDATRTYLAAARDYGIAKTFYMVGRPHVQELHRELSPEDAAEIEPMCVPDFFAREDPETFTTRWLEDIVWFWEQGSRVVKYWSAPRGRDFASDALILDSPIRLEGMKLAYDTGYRVFMTHVGDPDTWFQTKYADAKKYGTKASQYVPLERLLDQYHDVTWIGAHMGGWPEDLDALQGMLDRHPNYVLDSSATKWMVRELGRQPQRLAEFILANPGRVLFGTDIVASPDYHDPPKLDDDNPTRGHGYDQYASRFWALRNMIETDHAGESIIVDPDLHLVDPAVPKKSAPPFAGASINGPILDTLYRDAAMDLFDRAYGPEGHGIQWGDALLKASGRDALSTA